MLPLYRYACVAFVIHLAALLAMTFTIKGTPELYRVSFVFLGAVLRPQEVSPVRDQPAPAVELGSSVMFLPPGVSTRLWQQGIQVDKPDQAGGVLPRPDDKIPRFSGERVDPDQASTPRRDVHIDVPSLQGAFKLRLDPR